MTSTMAEPNLTALAAPGYTELRSDASRVCPPWKGSRDDPHRRHAPAVTEPDHDPARAPHVLHHVGLLAGTALVAGTGGTALFGVLGLAASVPLPLRLRRRFGTWWAPAIGLAVFAVMFSLPAFVIGPAISGSGDTGPPGDRPGGERPSPSTDHDGHHG